jgi:hypothetical protein
MDRRRRRTARRHRGRTEAGAVLLVTERPGRLQIVGAEGTVSAKRCSANLQVRRVGQA